MEILKLMLIFSRGVQTDGVNHHIILSAWIWLQINKCIYWQQTDNKYDDFTYTGQKNTPENSQLAMSLKEKLKSKPLDAAFYLLLFSGKEPMKDRRVIMVLVPDLKALSNVIVEVNGQTSPSTLPSQFHRLSVWVIEAPVFLLCCDFSNVFFVEHFVNVPLYSMSIQCFICMQVTLILC